MKCDRRSFTMFGGAALLNLAGPVSVQALTGGMSREDWADAIRHEGMTNSRAMQYASELIDGIGARLMGSPNMRKAYDWALSVLGDLGADNPRLEDFGEFGLSWRQNIAWLRMSAPDSMMMVAQAAPWSVSSNGPISGEAVTVELRTPEDFERYRGRLNGKIVLLGPLRPVAQSSEPLFRRLADEDILSGKASEPQLRITSGAAERASVLAQSKAFAAQKGRFLSEEGVLGVVTLSRATRVHGADTGIILTDGSGLTDGGWTAESRVGFPVITASLEGFGRAWRLVEAGVDVTLQFEIDASTLSSNERGYNVLAEWPGSDPRLKSEIVMLGAHLDSWAGGTGAVDDGAGVVGAIEAIRILRAVGAKPKRTIRLVLFGGEEQGLLGSAAYVKSHVGYSTSDRVGPSARAYASDIVRLADYEKISAYYNLDNGAGRARAVFDGGNTALGDIFRDWITPLGDLGMIGVIPHRDYPADQFSFEKIGVPGVSFLQDVLDYDSRAHHSNVDTIERIPAQDLAQLSTVLAYFVLRTANHPIRLPRRELD